MGSSKQRNHSVTFYALLFALTTTVIGVGLTWAVDVLRPASFWVEVIEARVLCCEESGNESAVVATYVWQRWTRQDMVVDTYIDMLDSSGHQLWSTVYSRVFYQEGEHRFIFEFQDFPYLEAGTYLLEGVIAFETPYGTSKTLSFEFEPLIIR